MLCSEYCNILLLYNIGATPEPSIKHCSNFSWYYCPRDPGCATYAMSAHQVTLSKRGKPVIKVFVPVWYVSATPIARFNQHTRTHSPPHEPTRTYMHSPKENWQFSSTAWQRWMLCPRKWPLWFTPLTVATRGVGPLAQAKAITGTTMLHWISIMPHHLGEPVTD